MAGSDKDAMYSNKSFRKEGSFSASVNDAISCSRAHKMVEPRSPWYGPREWTARRAIEQEGVCKVAAGRQLARGYAPPP
ncbi:hypothetical protein EON67_11350 [archaeon]|nr:MAG: hypothetical protein EON67_11350 [archaeon]